MACASAPMRTSIRGASYSPRASTSQPTLSRSAWRAAAMPTVFPRPAPVGRPWLASGGMRSSSFIHSPATCSAAAAAGDMMWVATFWSHAAVSQSAATEAGSAPPITNPK